MKNDLEDIIEKEHKGFFQRIKESKFVRYAAITAGILGVFGTGEKTKAADYGIKESQVTFALNGQSSTDIDKRYIVWHDYMDGDGDLDLYGYDMGPDGEFGTADDGGEFTITDNSSNQYYPKISKGFVVYQTDEFGDWDIELAKIVNGVVVGSVLLTNHNASQEHPKIYVDESNNITVIWSDNRNGIWDDASIDNDNWDVYKWESTTAWNVGVETQVTTNACDQFASGVGSDGISKVISWADSRNWECLFNGSETDVFIKIDNNPEYSINSNLTLGNGGSIDGELLAYSDFSNGTLNIVVYNWKTMIETLFDKPGHQNHPGISKDLIVAVSNFSVIII